MENENQNFQEEEEYINQDEIAEVIDPEQLEGTQDEDIEMETEDDEDEVIENDSEVRFTGHTGSIFAIALNPINQCYAISGGEDDRGFIWNIVNGEVHAELSGHTDSVVAVGFNITGEYAATGGMDGIIKIWDANTGKLVMNLDGPTEINWLQWHPKGNIILAGSNDGMLWMWLIPSGVLMNTFVGHQSSVSCGCFTPDGKNIISASDDGTLIFWNPKTAAPIYTIKPNDSRWHSNPITCLNVSMERNLVVSGSADGLICISQLQTGRIVQALDGHMDSVEDVAFCDCLPLMASASMDGTIRIWDLNNYSVRHVLNHDDAVIRLKWHKNSPILTSCSNDKTVRMWDARSGACLKVWKGHRKSILDFAMTPDGKVIATAGDDGESLIFMIDEE